MRNLEHATVLVREGDEVDLSCTIDGSSSTTTFEKLGVIIFQYYIFSLQNLLKDGSMENSEWNILPIYFSVHSLIYYCITNDERNCQTFE